MTGLISVLRPQQWRIVLRQYLAQLPGLLVAFGVFRYLFVLYKGGSDEEPGRDLLADKQIRFAVLTWAAVAILLVRT